MNFNETGGEPLYRGTFTTLYPCRSREEPDRKLVRKQFHPLLPDMPEDLRRQYNQDLHNAASIQRQVAAGGSSHWAPVHEIGERPDGCYFITDRYPSSLRQVFEARVRLTPEAIHTILTSMVSALRDLKGSLHRPHGNLKPSNVLIAGTAARPVSSALLCDPLPDRRLVDHSEFQDLEQAGRFLYQMVMRREVSDRPGWQAAATEEWRIFGKKSQQWLTFCKQLLHAPSSRDLTIEQCLERLQDLRPSNTGKIVKRSLLGIAFLSILAVVILIVAKRYKPPNELEWNAYIEDYLAWVWVLSDTVDGTPEPAKKQWKESGLTAFSEEGKVEEGVLHYPLQIYKQQDWVNNDEDFELCITAPERWPGFDQLVSPTPKVREFAKTKEAFKKIIIQMGLNNLDDSERWEYLAIENADGIEPWGCLQDLSHFENKFSLPQNEALKELVNFSSLIQSCEHNNTIGDKETTCTQIIDRINQIISLHPDVVTLQGNLTALINNLESADRQGDEGRVRGMLSEAYGRLEQTELSKLKEQMEAFNRQAGIWGDIYVLAKTASEDPENVKAVDQALNELLTHLGASPNPEACLDQTRGRIEELIITVAKYEEKIGEIHFSIPQFESLWHQHWKQHTIEQSKASKELLRVQYKEVFPVIRDLLGQGDAAFESIQSLPALPGVDWQDKHRASYEAACQAALNDLAKELENISCDRWLETLKVEAFYLQRLESLKSITERLQELCRMEAALSAWYLHEDPLPGLTETLAILNGRFPADSKFRSEAGFSDIFVQIERLRQIDDYSFEGQLDRPLFRYAVWLKQREQNLDSKVYLQEYRELLELLPASRRGELENKIEKQARETLDAFHTGQFESLKSKLEAHWTAIKTYAEFDEFVRQSGERSKAIRAEFDDLKPQRVDLRELNDRSDVLYGRYQREQEYAGRAVAFVESSEWLNENDYNRELFIQERLTPALLFDPETDLLNEYRQYAKCEDELFGELKNKRNEIQRDMESESGPEKDQALQLVNAVNADLERESRRAVVAHRAEIARLIGSPDAPAEGTLFHKLKLAEDLLTPAWCRAMKLEDGKVVFKDEAFNRLFEPVRLTHGIDNDPIADKTWDALSEDHWQALKDRDETVNDLQMTFFDSLDKDSKDHYWPRYIRSRKDPSVVLRYIPAGENVEPFYLAIRETTYEQYRKFLSETKFSGYSDPPYELYEAMVIRWTGLTPVDKRNGRVNQTTHLSMPELLSEYPVVWVNDKEAEAYLQWLEVDSHAPACIALPKVIQYQWVIERLSREGDSDVNIADEKDLLQAWKNLRIAQEQDNRSLNQIFPGGVFYNTQKGYAEKPSKAIGTIFPRKTTEGKGTMGIHDLQGNVWEWCSDGERLVVCGYSSLTPAGYVGPNRDVLERDGDWEEYTYKVRECDDVGLRIAVRIPAR